MPAVEEAKELADSFNEISGNVDKATSSLTHFGLGLDVLKTAKRAVMSASGIKYFKQYTAAIYETRKAVAATQTEFVKFRKTLIDTNKATTLSTSKISELFAALKRSSAVLELSSAGVGKLTQKLEKAFPGAASQALTALGQMEKRFPSILKWTEKQAISQTKLLGIYQKFGPEALAAFEMVRNANKKAVTEAEYFVKAWEKAETSFSRIMEKVGRGPGKALAGLSKITEGVSGLLTGKGAGKASEKTGGSLLEAAGSAATLGFGFLAMRKAGKMLGGKGKTGGKRIPGGGMATMAATPVRVVNWPLSLGGSGATKSNTSGVVGSIGGSVGAAPGKQRKFGLAAGKRMLGGTAGQIGAVGMGGLMLAGNTMGSYQQAAATGQGGGAGGAISGAMAGGMAGMVLGPIGAAIGAGVGGLASLVMDYFGKEKYLETERGKLQQHGKISSSEKKELSFAEKRKNLEKKINDEKTAQAKNISKYNAIQQKGDQATEEDIKEAYRLEESINKSKQQQVRLTTQLNNQYQYQINYLKEVLSIANSLADIDMLGVKTGKDIEKIIEDRIKATKKVKEQTESAAAARIQKKQLDTSRKPLEEKRDKLQNQVKKLEEEFDRLNIQEFFKGPLISRAEEGTSSEAVLKKLRKKSADLYDVKTKLKNFKGIPISDEEKRLMLYGKDNELTEQQLKLRNDLMRNDEVFAKNRKEAINKTKELKDLEQRKALEGIKFAQDIQEVNKGMIESRYQMFQSLRSPLHAIEQYGSKMDKIVELRALETTRLKELLKLQSKNLATQLQVQQSKAKIVQYDAELAQTADYIRRSWEEVFTQRAMNMPTGSYVLPTSTGLMERGPAFYPFAQEPRLADTAGGGKTRAGYGTYKSFMASTRNRAMTALRNAIMQQTAATRQLTKATNTNTSNKSGSIYNH